jgi:hypothetical protein
LMFVSRHHEPVIRDIITMCGVDCLWVICDWGEWRVSHRRDRLMSLSLSMWTMALLAWRIALYCWSGSQGSVLTPAQSTE